MQDIENRTREMLKEFRLPAYREIPDMGLYLKQVVHYIAEFIEPLGAVTLTESMVSNYVKQKLIEPPVHRLYFRKQIASLLFIAVVKTVLSMDEIRMLLDCRSVVNSGMEPAYTHFCRDLLSALRVGPGEADPALVAEKDDRPEVVLLHATVITVSNKIYVSKYFQLARCYMESNPEKVQTILEQSENARLAKSAEAGTARRETPGRAPAGGSKTQVTESEKRKET